MQVRSRLLPAGLIVVEADMTGNPTYGLRRRGFTLLELVIVVGLVLLVLALAWPSLDSAFQAEQLPAAALQVETVVREGRRMAFENGVVYRVEVESEAGAIRAVPEPDPLAQLALVHPARPMIEANAKDDEAATVERSLPMGVSVTEVTPPTEDDPPPASNPLELPRQVEAPAAPLPRVQAASPDQPNVGNADPVWKLFARLYPDGSADDAKLVLRDRDVREVEVRVKPLSAEVCVRSREPRSAESPHAAR